MIRTETVRPSLTMVAALLLCTGALFADTVSYTEDGIDFQLDVQDFGGTVGVTLTVDTTDYTGASTDALHATGFKIFDTDESSNATLTGAPGGTGGWFLKAGGATANTTHPDNDTTGASSGFITVIFDGMYGPAMDGSTYVFDLTYDTTAEPIEGWSLKGLTVRTSGQFDGRKSEQWSSGELDPEEFWLLGTAHHGTGVPEPSVILLLGFAAVAILLRWRAAARA